MSQSSKLLPGRGIELENTASGVRVHCNPRIQSFAKYRADFYTRLVGVGDKRKIIVQCAPEYLDFVTDYAGSSDLGYFPVTEFKLSEMTSTITPIYAIAQILAPAEYQLTIDINLPDPQTRFGYFEIARVIRWLGPPRVKQSWCAGKMFFSSRYIV